MDALQSSFNQPQGPATIEDFRERLASVAADLPKRLRQCAEYISANTDRIAVSTVAELAAGADVPPSALIRFCQILGFSGFSELQKLFRDAYAPGLPDYSTRLKNLKDGGTGSPSALLGEFIEAGRASLESLAKSCDEQALMQAVALISAADTVHISVCAGPFRWPAIWLMCLKKWLFLRCYMMGLGLWITATRCVAAMLWWRSLLRPIPKRP
jgi:Helix-turn-helix domain, rpiR family